MYLLPSDAAVGLTGFLSGRILDGGAELKPNLDIIVGWAYGRN